MRTLSFGEQTDAVYLSAIQQSWTYEKELDMPQMVMINSSGVVCAKLGPIVNVKNLKVSQGEMLSWENHFLTGVPKELCRTSILDHGAAKIYIRPIADTVIARIESPNAQDMHEAIELITLYLGGSKGAFSPMATSANSFIEGVRNDLVSLRQKLSRWFRSALQRFGFKIAA